MGNEYAPLALSVEKMLISSELDVRVASRLVGRRERDRLIDYRIRVFAVVVDLMTAEAQRLVSSPGSQWR